MPIKLIASWSY